MFPFRLSKAGWRVIEAAVASGWSQTWRLVLIFFAMAVLTLMVMALVLLLGGRVTGLAASAVTVVAALA